jgi:dipeptidyl aminopeptidase/acylaminoacyl peptidase
MMCFSRSCCLIFILTALTGACSDRSVVEPDDRSGRRLEAVTPVQLTGVVGVVVSPAPQVRVTDSKGRSLRNVTVRFGITGGGSTLTQSSSTDINGRATAAWSLGGSVGEYQLRAEIDDAAPVIFSARACLRLDGDICDVGPIACDTTQDCGKIAFVSDRSGNPEIYTSRIDGSDVRRLTDNLALDNQPVWSPDGATIAFVSKRFGGEALFVMSADGSNVRKLTSSDPFWIASAPTWSPDGRRIAYANGLGISIVDVATGTAVPAPIGFDRGSQGDPAWSPDGSRIAFVSDWEAFDFVYEVYTMNTDGTGIQKLLAGHMASAGTPPHPGTYFFQPAWSPDGARMAAVVCSWSFSYCFPESRLVVTSVNEPAIRVLAYPGGFSRPTWSKDGRMIAYSTQSCQECPVSIRYIHSDGSGVGGLIVNDGYHPSWRH